MEKSYLVSQANLPKNKGRILSYRYPHYIIKNGAQASNQSVSG